MPNVTAQRRTAGMRRHTLIAWLAVLTLLGALTTYRYGVRHQVPGLLVGETMGTTYNIKLGRQLTETERDAIDAAVERVLERIDSLMSTYRDDSELMRFNRHRSTTPFEASPETIEVIANSLAVSRLTDGAFDVTVAPLVDAWGFGRDRRDTQPSERDIAEVRRRVGYQLLEVDRARGALTKRAPELRCDLSAVAKGHAVDRVAEALERLGYRDYLVEIGGEVRARGNSEVGEPWRIGIEAPVAARGTVHEVLTLGNGALATSGSYRNFREVDGQRLSHTIDPRSGEPVTHRLLSVSVVEQRAARADALATALHVLGPEGGMALAEREELAALFLIDDGRGGVSRRETSAWQRLRRNAPLPLARGAVR